MIARIALALVAVALALVLGLQLRSARLEARADEVAKRTVLQAAGRGRAERPTPRDFEQAAFDARRARTLNPEPPLLVIEGSILLQTGRPAAATARFREATSREPMAVEGWVGLSVAARRAGQERLAAEAAGRVRELNPLGGR